MFLPLVKFKVPTLSSNSAADRPDWPSAKWPGAWSPQAGSEGWEGGGWPRRAVRSSGEESGSTHELGAHHGEGVAAGLEDVGGWA